MIQYPNAREAEEKNGVEVIFAFLLQIQEIYNEPFYGTIIKQITIPSYVTEIGYLVFEGCYLLKQITIPSSIDTKVEFNFRAPIDKIAIKIEKQNLHFY